MLFRFSTEYGVFGVPLSILVERDRDLKPDSEVPIFLSKVRLKEVLESFPKVHYMFFSVLEQLIIIKAKHCYFLY